MGSREKLLGLEWELLYLFSFKLMRGIKTSLDLLSKYQEMFKASTKNRCSYAK